MCDGKPEWIGWDKVREDITGEFEVLGERENGRRIVDFCGKMGFA